jgi:transposase
MNKFLSNTQRQELESEHRSESKRQYADRIKAILSLDSGWSAKKIAEILLLDERSIWNYPKLYEEGGIDRLCSANYKGREFRLSEEQHKELIEHLRVTIYSTSSEVASYVKSHYGVMPQT